MARWTGKVVGGFLGSLAGGPVGAALGVLFGHQFDVDAQEAASKARRRTYADPPPPPPRPTGGSLEGAYRLLEISASATDAEVAKAYRRQLSRHHPDKLEAQGLSKARLDEAKARTQAIIKAYELICQCRKGR